MKHLSQLRTALKEKNTARDAVLAKMSVDTYVAAADDTKSLGTLNAEIDELETPIDAIVKAQDSKAASTKRANDPIDQGGAGGGDDEVDPATTRRLSPEAAKKLTFSEKTGLVVMAVAASAFKRRDGDHVPALKILDDHGFGIFAKMVSDEMRRQEAFIKTLNASTNVSGGYLTPDMMAQDIIELLYPETTFLQGNPRTVQMPNGVYSQPAGASSATAAYRKEGARIINSEPTFKKIQMSVKFLGAIVPMTRQMIDFSVPGARAFVEGDLREVMAQTLDSKAYFGDGTDGEPLGLVNYPGVASVTVLGTNVATLAQIDSTETAFRLSLLNNNITNMTRWRYVMHPRTLAFLQNKRVDTDVGNFAYPETRGESPRWNGIPILVSTQIPINLGSGADESYILLVNFADVLFGIQEGLMLATSSEASITINGTMVSAFENDLVFLRATSAHDIGSRRVLSIVVAVAVRWGA